MLKQLDTLIGFAVVMSVISMLIMVATQAISSILAFRGRNLRDALEALFRRIVPGLDAYKARALAEVALKLPTVSDSSLSIKGSMPESWKLAADIRPEECLGAIKRIAAFDAETLKGFLSESGKEAVEKAQIAATRVLNALRTPEVKRAANAALKAVQAVAPVGATEQLKNAQEKIGDLLVHAAGAVQSEAEYWTTRFKSVQDRADQWFTMNARRVTVILAFVAAFALQLNAFELFSRLANDAELRNQLVNLSPNIQKRVDDALNVKFAGTVYLAALQQLKKGGKITADPNTADTMTNATAKKWLTDQSVNPEVLADYDKAVQEQARQRTKAAKDEFNEMVGLYNQTSLRLIPEQYPLTFGGSFPYVHRIREFFGFTGWRPGAHFFGMFGAAMLLALGAPFWFNLLKSLASLRSQVSEKIDQENQKDNK